MNRIESLNVQQWENNAQNDDAYTTLLEQGSVLYAKDLSFILSEKERDLLNVNMLSASSKNISWNGKKNRLSGSDTNAAKQQLLTSMMQRYAKYTMRLLHDLCPHYKNQLIQARTSYRPAQVQGRVTSAIKDDTRLHVDAFPSTPMQRKRILRVFTNINPCNQPRSWRLGEAFDQVSDRFLPTISAPLPGSSFLLKTLKLTKSRRTPYDHYMLQLHDKMKLDAVYQKNAEQISFDFLSGSTWMTFTDQVSHAAMSGQFLLEQSFYLPVDAMLNPEQSPLRILEKKLDRRLTA